MILFTNHNIDIEAMVKLIAQCMSNNRGFEPYKPNEQDDSLWTLDQGNDWKVKFHDKRKMEVIHRYHNESATKALSLWIAYRTGGIILNE